MSEVHLELSLSRSSGVLAGVVAALAQAGIELKSQKLQRVSTGRGGSLTIIGEGDPPAAPTLAERLKGIGGVERLIRMVVDGETVLAEGKPLTDQIRSDDLAELSAGSKAPADRIQSGDPARSSAGSEETPASQHEQLPPLLVDDEAEEPSLPETAVKAGEGSPDQSPEKSPEQAPKQVDRPADQEVGAKHGSKSPDGGADDDLAAALETANAEFDPDDPTPEFAAEPTAEDDLAEALAQDDRAPATETRATEVDGDTDVDRVQATLRRRRRRRR